MTPRASWRSTTWESSIRPKDLRLGLVEASAGKIGSPVDNILTYCYHYDPQMNRHSLIMARVVQLGGLVTVFGLGGFMLVMFRRDHRKRRSTEKRERIKGTMHYSSVQYSGNFSSSG